MNAPATTAAIAAQLEQIPLAEIKPSGTHIQELRRQRFSKDKLAELAANIKQLGGVMQAVLVRPIKPEGAVKYELVFGERRWTASKMVGLTHVPATIRNMTDAQVLEAQMSENLEREDLHELEEAEGYEELMKVKKVNAEALAAMFGISRSQVYARTKLLALCPEGRKAFYDGELDASRALLIARIGHHDTQREALKDITQGERRLHGDQRPGEPMTYREAHRHVLQRFMLKLAAAPFDIKDAALLTKAGDCIKCPKRTGNQAELFSDVKNADVCTDPQCFDDKRQAHFATARKKKEAAGHKVIAGAEAKQLLPNWESGGNHAYLRDGSAYVRLDANEYIGGRYVKIAEALGKDYVPVLIQHPFDGKFIEVAPRSTVASKAAAKSRARSSSGGASHRSASPAKPAGPDIEELVAQRVIERLAKKPIGLDRGALLFVAEQEMWAWDHTPDFLLKMFKLPTSGRTKLDKLSTSDLERFLVLGTIANDLLSGGGLQAEKLTDEVCRRHKVDRKKVKAEIEAELKKKDAEKKAADAAKGNKPAKGGAAWPFPTGAKAPIGGGKKKAKKK